MLLGKPGVWILGFEFCIYFEDLTFRDVDGCVLVLSACGCFYKLIGLVTLIWGLCY